MPINDTLAAVLMVIFIPMGFVWADRHQATGRRALVFGGLALLCGVLALLMFLAASGGGMGAAGPGLLALGLGFAALELLSWALQTAVVALVMPPQPHYRGRRPVPRPSEPFDAIGVRGLLALTSISFISVTALAVWLWTGKAINLLRLIGFRDRHYPEWLSYAQNAREFTLQIILVAMIALAAVIGMVGLRGQI